MKVEIIKIALTIKNEGGEVKLIMQGDLPDESVAIFVRKEDYEQAKKAIESV
jgi:hypothetical protein